MILYEVCGWYENQVSGEREELGDLGIFSSLEKALEVVRNVKDDDAYSGKYREYCQGEGIYECVYGETENYTATHFDISPVKLDKVYDGILY